MHEQNLRIVLRLRVEFLGPKKQNRVCRLSPHMAPRWQRSLREVVNSGRPPTCLSMALVHRWSEHFQLILHGQICWAIGIEVVPGEAAEPEEQENTEKCEGFELKGRQPFHRGGHRLFRPTSWTDDIQQRASSGDRPSCGTLGKLSKTRRCMSRNSQHEHHKREHRSRSIFV